MGVRILIVDDNPDIGLILVELLSIAGHDARVARNGAEALACLEDAAYDLIVSDVTMPELDGEGFYRALLQCHPEYAGRVVFMTGHHDPAVLAFLEGTPVRVLRKPFSLGELGPEIGQALLAPDSSTTFRCADRPGPALSAGGSAERRRRSGGPAARASDPADPSGAR